VNATSLFLSSLLRILLELYNRKSVADFRSIRIEDNYPPPHIIITSVASAKRILRVSLKRDMDVFLQNVDHW